MHSLDGAQSETMYIYGYALDRLAQQKRNTNEDWPVRVFSLGLGLGYNEIMTAAFAIKHAWAEEFEIDSFESVDELRELFLNWIRSEDLSHRPLFQRAYDDISQRMAHAFNVDATEIKKVLLMALQSQRLRLNPALDPETKLASTYSCFLYDAFSAKTSPDLWNEDFLSQLLARHSHSHSVFATYACTSALKRSLKRSGYSLHIREGFGAKRESTFAIK